MTLKTHIISSSLLAAGIYATTVSWPTALAALLGGVLIDLDHVFDFIVFSGKSFSVKKLFEWCNREWEKSLYILHSYELYILLLIINEVAEHSITTGILMGTGLHLLLDQIGNRYFLKDVAIKPYFYFITFRISKEFRKELLLDTKPSGIPKG